LREGKVDFHGKYYEVNESVLKPRGPSATGPKLWIGSKAPRMLELTAKYADAWNTVWHIDPAVVLERYAPLKEACAKAGRDLSTLELTAGTYVRFPEPGVEDDGKSITGTDEEIAAKLQAFADIGVTHLIVILRPSTSPVTIERFARVVAVLDRG
jgi:alkanesulfonate monooxygenase SsuD/methylene tetrahydromethanopterin reductase-like flavin-dependent oxidoreductase (luciferase family)